MFEWEHFLFLAERLVLEVESEAAQRSAISRAYYAIYHAASAFVRRHGILGFGQSHRAIWSALAADPRFDLSFIGDRGNALKQLRVAADYRNPFPENLRERATFAIGEARLLLEALNQLDEV